MNEVCGDFTLEIEHLNAFAYHDISSDNLGSHGVHLNISDDIEINQHVPFLTSNRPQGRTLSN